MVESGFLQAALLIVGLFVLVVVCALFQGRPRPHAYSQEELGQIRIDRELAKEVAAAAAPNYFGCPTAAVEDTAVRILHNMIHTIITTYSSTSVVM